MTSHLVIGMIGLSVIGVAAFKVLFPDDASKHSNSDNGWKNADYVAREQAKQKAEAKAARKEAKKKGRSDA